MDETNMNEARNFINSINSIFSGKVVETCKELGDLLPCTLKHGDTYYVRELNKAFTWDALNYIWDSNVHDSEKKEMGPETNSERKTELIKALKICIAERKRENIDSENNCMKCSYGNDSQIQCCTLICRQLLEDIYNFLKGDCDES